ncbi:MAG: GNAT family N-acetyltransferase [Bacteroidota bacterium]|nr:GNAT family N-acetyltransferase [Bacteroidota bacterium]
MELEKTPVQALVVFSMPLKNISATTYKLDNPAWYSLTETHKIFAMGNDEIKRYEKTIAPFVACHPDKKDILRHLDSWISPHESFFMIGDLPELPSNYIRESKLPCIQMICTKEINITPTAVIQELGKPDDEDMLSLINLVQPGYYNPGTRLMGDYYGIRYNGQLVSLTGERMRMNGFTEISAVVTHPGFTGRQYAQQLIAHVANKNRIAGITPFLHVAETNERAIKLYQHLGFVQRRMITFRKMKRIS